MVARVGIKPAILRTQGTEPTTKTPRPHVVSLTVLTPFRKSQLKRLHKNYIYKHIHVLLRSTFWSAVRVFGNICPKCSNFSLRSPLAMSYVQNSPSCCNNMSSLWTLTETLSISASIVIAFLFNIQSNTPQNVYK